MHRYALLLSLSGLAACGGAPSPAVPSVPTPPSSASAAPGPKADAPKKNAAEDAAKQAAAIDALTEGEAKKGACDPDHKAALDKLLDELEAAVKAKKGDDGQPLMIQTVDKRTLALGPAPRTITMSVTGRGTEVHVIAMALRDVSMDVMSAGTAATTMRSPFQRILTAPKIDVPEIGTVTDFQSDSRQIQIKPGQPLEVKLHGQGCTLVAAFQKL
jgi:hypothetical protein